MYSSYLHSRSDVIAYAVIHALTISYIVHFLERRPDRVYDKFDIAYEKKALGPMRCEYCDCYHDVEQFCEENNCCTDM